MTSYLTEKYKREGRRRVGGRKLWESSNEARLCNVMASEVDLTLKREEKQGENENISTERYSRKVNEGVVDFLGWDVPTLLWILWCPKPPCGLIASWLPNPPAMSLRGIKEAKASLLPLLSPTLAQESLTGSEEGFIFCMYITHALVFLYFKYRMYAQTYSRNTHTW